MRAHLLLAAGVFGLIEAVVPGPFVRVLTRVAYRNAADAEPKPWLLVAARIEGAVIVVGALVGLFRLARDDDSTAGPEADGDPASEPGAE